MTAASVHLTGSAMRSRWRGFVTLLAVVLPVPLFAALGLSLPLPATVERIAAKLVPFENAEIGELRASQGTIVLVPGDRRSATGSGTSEASTPSRLPIGADVRRPRGETVAGGAQSADEPSPAPGATERENAPTAVDGKEAPPVGGPSTPTEEEPPPGGGSDPGPSPGVVDTATNTVNGAVNTAAETAGSATNTAADTAKDAVAPLLPP